MILVRTPYRISLFGGGTDFPDWYLSNGGLVLSTTINKYCYVTIRTSSVLSPYRHRVTYSKTELVNNSGEIQHPVVREIFKQFDKEEQGMEMHHFSDLPARSGVGSSSAFAVGLLHAVQIYRGRVVDKRSLAEDAISLERHSLNENVGDQDQIASAFGGLNSITFGEYGWSLEPLRISQKRRQEILDHIILLNTGISRNSSEITRGLMQNISNGKSHLKSIYDLAVESRQSILSNSPIRDLGILLRESWKYKVLSNPFSTTEKAELILKQAISSGALGGKLLGAGGGGFMMIMVEPKNRESVLNDLMIRFKELIEIPIRFDVEGSKCLYFEKDQSN